MPPTCPIYTQESSDALVEELRAKVKQMRAGGTARSEEGRRALKRALSQLYYHTHRQSIGERSKLHRKLFTAAKRRGENAQRREWKRRNPQRNLWSAAKYRSKKDGIDFNIDPEDLFIPERCPYLDLLLTSDKGVGKLDNLVSIDRINPALGYVKGNVEVISYKANRMKNDATRPELIRFATNVLKRFKNEQGNFL